MIKLIRSNVVTFLCASLLLVPQAFATFHCGSLEGSGQYGPYDYRDPGNKENLYLVEIGHFTPQVENLTKGESTYIGGDLDYTLRAFPNHPRALQSIMRLSQREKKSKPAGARYTVECYFERAIRFRPDDGTVHMLHGMFLNTQSKLDEAIAQVEKANQLSPNDANINYNLGLLYFDKKNFAKSRAHAKIAYELGFPLPGLKNKLTKAGQWEGN